MPFDTAGEVAGPGRQGADQVDRLKPGTMVVDGLALQRRVVDDALHDQFAGGTRGEQAEKLAYLSDFADAREFDDVALDRGSDVVAEPAGPVPGGEPADLGVPAGADSFEQVPAAEAAGLVCGERGGAGQGAVDEAVR